jgi:DNA-directed RNA polymerase specialized sigma24 family protein
MGAGDGSFRTTKWTIIDKIAAGRQAGEGLVNELTSQYWKPVYCCLRKKGYDNEAAKDLTQGFFQEVVCGRDLIARADQKRGRFRNLLLTALDNYLASQHRRATADKRIPPNKLVSTEHIDPAAIPDHIYGATEAESFNYAWLSELLDRVLGRVQAKYRRDGLEVYWRIFHDRVIAPILEDTKPPGLPEVCAKYNIETAAKVSNIIGTVKRRFQAELKKQLRLSVFCDADVETELGELIRFFDKGTARSQKDGVS